MGERSGKERDEEEINKVEEEDKDEDEDDEEKEVVKEYVEKVADTGQKNPSGHMAGTGAKSEKQGERNTKSIVASKNDMGGTAAFTKGGNQDQDGTRPAAAPKPKGTLVADPQNKPGAKAGSTFAKKETAVNKEEGAVNATSPLAK